MKRSIKLVSALVIASCVTFAACKNNKIDPKIIAEGAKVEAFVTRVCALNDPLIPAEECAQARDAIKTVNGVLAVLSGISGVTATE